MGKAKGGKQVVDEYRMSIHFGISLGIDALRGIYIGERTAWEGRMAASGTISLNDPNFFGGPKKSGGIEGKVYYLAGEPTQVMPAPLARRFGLTPATCPAFRGLGSVFFTGDSFGQISLQGGLPFNLNLGGAYASASGGGFYWSANSPYVQTVWIKAERAPKSILPIEHRMIGTDNANPAHMVYECLTDDDFGMGGADYDMDYAAFVYASKILFDEGFGMSTLWTRQTEIENFVSEVLDHIQATIFTNPRTGLLGIKLLRDDYDINTLRRINSSNSTITDFQRKLWGDTVNEITVTWTNPANEQEETVTRQNLANVVSQGAPVAASRNYYGIRSAELAGRIADRDVRTSSAPLASIEVECLRSVWDVLPGEILLADFPEIGEGVEDLVMRVMNVDYGKPADSKIKLTLMEDVFSLSRPAPSGTPQTQISGAAEVPGPMTNVEIITLPAFLMSPMASSFTDETYPEVVGAVLAYRPGSDLVGYDLYAERVATNGATTWAQIGTKSIIGRAVMATPLYPEAVSTVDGIPLIEQGRGPTIGGLAFIGTGGDPNMEVALLRSISDTGTWTLDRGVLDTIPKFWPVGTPVWFVPLSAVITDDDLTHAAGETPEFKLLTRTSLGTLAFDLAPVVTGTLTGRPHLPLRPANVKVNGVGFGDVDLTGKSSIVVTWSNRNRTTEDGQVTTWGAGSVTPEYLQETIVTVYRQSGAEMIRFRGLWTENTLTIPIAYVQQEQRISIRVSSEREGLASLQSYVLFCKNIPQIANPAAPPASPTPAAPPPPPAAQPNPTPVPIPAPGTAPPTPAGGGGSGPRGEWTRVNSV